MLSGHKLGRGRIDYYLAYAGREGEGRWFGRGATALGLTGSVQPADFRALAAGTRPEGGALLERVPADRVPGWDFTLSAPKSVSLCWALAGLWSCLQRAAPVSGTASVLLRRCVACSDP